MLTLEVVLGCPSFPPPLGVVLPHLPWEIDFYAVRVWVRSCVFPKRVPNPNPTLIKNLHPWVQEFYPVWGLGSGGRRLMHFQTPTLRWIHFSP